MTLVVALCATFAYLTVWLLATRHWYGKWRIEEAEKRAGVKAYRRNEKRCSDGEIAVWAGLTGLAWWAAGPVYGLRWLITANQPRAPHEVAAEKARRKTAVAELERENEMGT